MGKLVQEVRTFSPFKPFLISKYSNIIILSFPAIRAGGSKKYESALERSNGRSYQNFTPDRTCVLPKNTKKIS